MTILADTDLTFLVWMFFNPTNELLNFLIYFLLNFYITALHLHNNIYTIQITIKKKTIL